MEEHSLTLVEQTPPEVVKGATIAAKELHKLVSSREKRLVLGDKQYLFFEDWQTVGKFYGVTASVTKTEELRDGDNFIGFLAHAIALKDGNEVSGADAECTRDEPNWQDKPRFQLRSMSQTRACAKALRNCLGWVAVLAGYEPTPAEEMAGVKTGKGHWCSIHNCTFFKKGKMKGWAHKIGDTSEWCNEESTDEPIDTRDTTEPREGDTPDESEGIPTNAGELLKWVSSHGKDYNRTWLVNGPCKIEEKRITEEIESVYEEVKALMGW